MEIYNKNQNQYNEYLNKTFFIQIYLIRHFTTEIQENEKISENMKFPLRFKSLSAQ